MTDNIVQKKLRKALRRLFCFGLLCVLPASSPAQEQQKPQVRQPSAKSASRTSAQNSAGQNSAGPQWMKSAHRGWVAAPNGARPPASIRLASLKAQEEPTGESSDKAPSAAPAAPSPESTAAPEATPAQADVAQNKSVSDPATSGRELTDPQAATPPADPAALPTSPPRTDSAAPSASPVPPSTAAPAASGQSPQQLREPLPVIREKMRESILNRPDNVQPTIPGLSVRGTPTGPSSTGLSDLLIDDLTSNDEIRRQRAQEFQKVQLRLRLLLEQEKQRQAQAKLTQPPVTPPAPNSVVPDQPPVTPDSHAGQNTPHPETVHPVPEMLHPQPELVKPHPAPPPKPLHPNPDSARKDHPGPVVQPEHTDDLPHHDEETEGHETDGGHDPHVEHPTVTARKTVDGTIDHLGLANNLFAVGQFELSLEIYQKVDLSTVSPQQQFWVEYQQASCLRRLGRSAEASNKYRRLADKPEAGSLSELARWWVTTLEHKRQLEKKLAEKPGQAATDEHAPDADHHNKTHAPGVPLKSTPHEDVAAPNASSDSGHSSGH